MRDRTRAILEWTFSLAVLPVLLGLLYCSDRQQERHAAEKQALERLRSDAGELPAERP